jgi:hypothetical protein
MNSIAGVTRLAPVKRLANTVKLDVSGTEPKSVRRRVKTGIEHHKGLLRRSPFSYTVKLT